MSGSTTAAGPAPGLMQVDLTKLNLNQLGELKSQLEQEMTYFQNSLQTLKMAQSKFSESGEVCNKITPDSKGQNILVPLTGSIYVPGFISDTEKVLVDIGTGYYVEMDMTSAKDYFKRKAEFVSKQVEKIQHLKIEKFKIRDLICELMEKKIQNELSSQSAAS